MESIIPIAFPFVFIGMLVWFFLVSTLFRRLKQSHPEKFHAMGDPGLFMNNTPCTNWAFMKFLFKREDLTLSDPSLSRLRKIMVIFLLWQSFITLIFMVTLLSVAHILRAR